MESPREAEGRVAYGVAAHMGMRKKDEDRTSSGRCTVGGERFLYVGLFDGHGGKGAADLCKRELHKRVEALGNEALARGRCAGPSEAVVAGLVAACWELDDRLGTKAVDSGTTATCLFIREGADAAGDAVLPKNSRATFSSNEQCNGRTFR